jgi:hypothetical protein
MATQAQTFNGLLSTLKDNAMAALMAFTGPLFEAAKAGLQALGTAVSSPEFAAFAAVLGQQVGAAISAVAGFIQGTLLPALTQGGAGFDQLLAIVQPVMDGIQAIVAAVLPIVAQFWADNGALAESIGIQLPD